MLGGKHDLPIGSCAGKVKQIAYKGDTLIALDIEKLYQERMDALEPWERVERSVAMFCWVRENLARQIVKEQGSMSEERLRHLVARRQYQNEPQIVAWIDQLLADIPE